MYCIRVGEYWLGRDKEEYLSPSILSVEKYVLTEKDTPGVTLWFKDLKDAEVVLSDYRKMSSHYWNAQIKYKSEMEREIRSSPEQYSEDVLDLFDKEVIE